MGRHVGNKNKTAQEKVITSSLHTNERISLVANLIVDKILEDQKTGKKLLIEILKQEYGKPTE